MFTTTRVCCGFCACASGRPRRVRMDPTEVRLRKVVMSSLNKRLGFTQVKPATVVPANSHAAHRTGRAPKHKIKRVVVVLHDKNPPTPEKLNEPFLSFWPAISEPQGGPCGSGGS